MDKVVLITGGSRGIGKRLVEDFANNGYKVAFTYLSSRDSAECLADILNGKGLDVYCDKMDLASDEDINRFVSSVVDRYGHIDVLINNGATTHDSLFDEKDRESFDRVLSVNLVGTFVISKMVGELMRKQKAGTIINISSTNGMGTYFPMCLEYDASKSALNSLTHNLAMQFAPYIRVNAIAPGFIATESEIDGMDEEYLQMEADKILLKRLGTEEDVSNLALFLADEKSNYINNQIIKVNGGVYGEE